MSKSYTDEQLLDIIRLFAKQHNRKPRLREIAQGANIKRRFGSWNAALEKAGFAVTKRSKSFTVSCANCGAERIARDSEIRKSKSGRLFCSRKCAAIGNSAHQQGANNAESILRRTKPQEGNTDASLPNVDFDDLSPERKRNRVILEQNNACNHCGIDTWRGRKLTLELEHKNGNHSDNSRDNLEALCPNCHSLTETWRGKNKSKRVTDDEFKAALRVSKTIREALIRLGLSPRGTNYVRAKRLLTELVHEKNGDW